VPAACSDVTTAQWSKEAICTYLRSGTRYWIKKVMVISAAAAVAFNPFQETNIKAVTAAAIRPALTFARSQLVVGICLW